MEGMERRGRLAQVWAGVYLLAAGLWLLFLAGVGIWALWRELLQGAFAQYDLWQGIFFLGNSLNALGNGICGAACLAAAADYRAAGMLRKAGKIGVAGCALQLFITIALIGGSFFNIFFFYGLIPLGAGLCGGLLESWTQNSPPPEPSFFLSQLRAWRRERREPARNQPPEGDPGQASAEAAGESSRRAGGFARLRRVLYGLMGLHILVAGLWMLAYAAKFAVSIAVPLAMGQDDLGTLLPLLLLNRPFLGNLLKALGLLLSGGMCVAAFTRFRSGTWVLKAGAVAVAAYGLRLALLYPAPGLVMEEMRGLLLEPALGLVLLWGILLWRYWRSLPKEHPAKGPYPFTWRLSPWGQSENQTQAAP